MWLTSKRPTAVRTARCSAMRPPPGQGYSTGMSQPPKSTILAFRARCVALSAVFLRAGATGAEGVAMGVPFKSKRYVYHDRESARRGQTKRRQGSIEEANSRRGSSHVSVPGNRHACGRGCRFLPWLANAHRKGRVRCVWAWRVGSCARRMASDALPATRAIAARINERLDLPRAGHRGHCAGAVELRDRAQTKARDFEDRSLLPASAWVPGVKLVLAGRWSDD